MPQIASGNGPGHYYNNSSSLDKKDHEASII
jgi:hypothetical protein